VADDLREAAAAALWQADQTKQPRVGILLPASASFVASFYGTLLAGKTVVPINFLLGEKEIAHIVSDSDIDTVITVPQLMDKVKEVGSETQFYQEMGGLLGRIALALLIIVGIGRRLLLRLLQVPGLIVLPLTYFMLYKQDAHVFSWGIAIIGFVTMSQLSFLGEYLPKVFPLHLRGTGGSFATNVGGRMIGTSAAFITPKLAQMLTGSPYDQMAQAAGWMGLGIVVIGFILGMFLPEPKAEVLD